MHNFVSSSLGSVVLQQLLLTKHALCSRRAMPATVAIWKQSSVLAHGIVSMFTAALNVAAGLKKEYERFYNMQVTV